MRFYIADNHFYHAILNTSMDKRGFDTVEEMNEYMIEKWNKKVKKKDEVVIIGDFSWGSEYETCQILDRLKGKLYLVTGNHDKTIMKSEKLKERFGWVKSYAELSDNGRKVVLCHYPMLFYNGQYRLSKNDVPLTYMLYGHVHDTDDQKLILSFQEQIRNYKRVHMDGVERGIPSNMINCFCKYSDYEPLTLDEWIELYSKREIGE